MRITRLHARDFRGFVEVDLALHPRCTLFVGANASGKTSLLHAISLASRLRGLTEGVDVVRRGAPGAVLEAWGENDGIAFQYPTLMYERDGSVTAQNNGGHHWAPNGLTRLPDDLDSEPGARDRHDVQLVTWLRTCQGIELQRAAANGEPAYRLPELERVRKAVRSFFAGSELVYDFEANDVALRKQGELFGLKTLSSGERDVIALVCGVVMLAPTGHGGDFAGVLIVDEIEEHLHPVWQRKILPSLMMTFPALQIIATTHSPQVVGSVSAEHIRIIDDHRIRAVSRGTWRRDTNDVLETAFGDRGRPPEAAELLDRLRALVEADDVVEARVVARRLRSLVEGEDPEIFFLEQLLPPEVPTGTEGAA